ncbi:tRNA (adenosine(37)-N6)-threonylcarbamoyltransferase complex dimerization subunit type 1 TsaB [Youxingia wuxianensis]|uniref:tRNA (Adenosine(37)-N6)-threonylcarbamoyltransferase complex dimerization subunit type 1 TsaB n=1 Tax=Youxingia wuxianensis TaxID=2763678 RepID=A0A926IHY1_9FIRM|nr:tRNA (adenosine(37)-N6)-threonylcarbamoyltransferase complex dimerization subunit type 1 TsaB [Youxingia wuxianensis]MBC8585781.1 tRNA (adenosine(37)-N6)-threonylcarbamoyltransferase complex dimerization subunit type 1 TsaB [Youxingia wuxianensis]
MKLLAVDTSSITASCALLEDKKLLGEFFSNVKLTHSQTIMPMVESLLKQTRVSLEEIDAFAVTGGPGSFTGLRIGLAAVKGMAWALERPCITVSTLEALAYNLYGIDCVVAPVLDARCSQVYTALFRWEGERITRLEEDDAISLQNLKNRLKNVEKPVFLVGDGAEMCYNNLCQEIPHLRLPSPALIWLRSSALGAAALSYAADGITVSPAQLAPCYLRLPQAQRELLAKKNKGVKEK